MTGKSEIDETLRLAQFSLDHAPDAVYWMDPGGRFLYVNETACRTLGYTREELLSMGVADIDPSLPDGVPPEMAEATKRAGVGRVETEHRTKDGRIIPVEVMVAYIAYEGKEYHCSFSRDISERKQAERLLMDAHKELEKRVKERTRELTEEIAERERAEEEKERLQSQLIQSQKMEAVGTLAGGIAHDFNNIMTVVKTMASMALGRTGDNPGLRECLEPILYVSDRGVSLVQQLLTFSQKKSVDLRSLDLNAIIGGLLQMLRTLVSEDVSIESDLEDGLWNIRADRSRLEQVITNLVLNSSDAMPQGGKITLRTNNIMLTEEYARTVQGATPGNFVCLTVEDTGTGMDKETMEHIFEPFFTTRSPGGTGLGLSVVFGIVKDLKGWVDVSSEPGIGSRFMAYFPESVEGNESVADASGQRKAAKGEGRRILLVEDEAWVRRSTALLLSDNGYVVFEAADAEQAINIFSREKGQFDLVLSDVVMPGSSGLQLVSLLLEIKSDIPVLFFSGHINNKAQLERISRDGFAYIRKPFEPPDLLQAIEDCIGRV